MSPNIQAHLKIQQALILIYLRLISTMSWHRYNNVSVLTLSMIVEIEHYSQ